MLTSLQREGWERDGFFIVPGFGSADECEAMHARAVALARQSGGAGMAGTAFVQPEAKESDAALEPEDRVSKIFKLHREEPVFRNFIGRERVLRLGSALLGPNLDCFLSQFIFKNAGALGQPWHQDSFYFRFDRTPQVGLWLAVTEATLANGCLHVLPGSHREPVHTHVSDARSGANYGYVEIVDHDMSAAIPVEMNAGDLLVFHSHLMHRSTDNESSGLRAAMVYHLGEAGTVDRDSTPVPINDWMPVHRRIETQIDIAAPLERVRAALLDASRYPDWNPYLVRVEGKLESGAEILAYGKALDGQIMAMHVHVVAVEPDRMRWEGGLPDRAQFKGDHHFVLEALAEGHTRLHHHEDFSGTLLGEIVVAREPVIRSNFERMNVALRSYCESPG